MSADLARGRARLYARVPPEALAPLHRFRARYPERRAHVAGTEWTYFDTASGEATVLVLTGAACVALMSWKTIDHLARRYRVVAPDYPSVDTMAALLDGIAGLLDTVGVERCHVMGGSYGGFVAQAFVRRYPDRAASLILSHTLLPSREGATRVARLARWIGWLPIQALRMVVRLRLGRLFPEGPDPKVALSKALFAEIVGDRLSKGQIVSLMRRVVDLGLNHRFAPDDLRAWPGRILLLMADDDPATPPPARQAITEMYPGAQVRTFSGGGHLTAILKQEEYFAAIDDFLRT